MSDPAVSDAAGAVQRWVLERLFDPASHEARGNWQPFREGIEIMHLFRDGSSGAATALLRYAKGARAPMHRHADYEHILVLSGSQRDENGTYGPGTCLVHAPGTRHSVVSDDGCVVLAIWGKPVVFDGA